MRFTFISAGAPRHGRNLQRQVQQIADAEGWGWETRFIEWDDDSGRRFGYAQLNQELGDGDALWNVGNFGNFFEWAAGLDAGVAIIAHWIGTDILQHRDILAQAGFEPFSRCHHYADAPHLVDEARQLTGLGVGYVRSIPPAVVRPSPIEGWDHVVCYVPAGREDFFRYPWIQEVARDFPAVQFDVLRPGLPGPAAARGNLVELSEQGPGGVLELLTASFAVLRPCVHDGISLTCVEAAQLGRHIIHSDVRVPYVLPGRSVGEIESQLDYLLERRPQQREDAVAFYRDEYSLDALKRDLAGLRGRQGW